MATTFHCKPHCKTCCICVASCPVTHGEVGGGCLLAVPFPSWGTTANGTAPGCHARESGPRENMFLKIHTGDLPAELRNFSSIYTLFRVSTCIKRYAQGQECQMLIKTKSLPRVMCVMSFCHRLRCKFFVLGGLG